MNDFHSPPFAREPNAPQDTALRHVAAGFLSAPPEASHTVQFYDDDAFLFRTVGGFASAGLDAGDGVLLIATEAHTAGILAQLAPERVTAGLHRRQFVVLDARTTLESFLSDGLPDPERFHAALCAMFSAVQVPFGRQLRAFGEMVDLLWRDGNPQAAIRLEELWGAVVQGRPISLLCAYGSDHFREHGDSAGFSDVCRTHTHVLPSEGFSQLADAESRLREVSLLQQQARALEGEIRQRKALEGALREVLEGRTQVELELRSSIEREHVARTSAQASDAFREVLMGVVGHDLREPLNSILTTARRMTLREELTSDGQKRLDRVVSSGVRMQRMIDQILDLARDSWTTGIALSRTARAIWCR